MLFEKILSALMLTLLTAGVFADDEPQKKKDDTDTQVEYVFNVQNGDLDGDDRRDITDVIGLFNYLFAGGLPPVFARCEPLKTAEGGDETEPESWSTVVANGDVDGSGRIDITDAILFLHWLFAGGDEPARLGCESFLSQESTRPGACRKRPPGRSVRGG